MSPVFLGWWRDRTPREQRLLIVMAALMILLLVWLMLVRPLGDALDSAQRRHAAAVVALAQAQSRAELGRSGESARAAAPVPVEGFLARTAAQAGFVDARIAGRGPEAAVVTIASARPPALFAWVGLMENRGLSVRSLRIRANDDRTVAAEIHFRARRR